MQRRMWASGVIAGLFAAALPATAAVTVNVVTTEGASTVSVNPGDALSVNVQVVVTDEPTTALQLSLQASQASIFDITAWPDSRICRSGC